LEVRFKAKNRKAATDATDFADLFFVKFVESVAMLFLCEAFKNNGSQKFWLKWTDDFGI
jgi:hypothetical protein